jgi:adenine deaminase
LKDLLDASLGKVPCDLLIKGGRVANVLSMEFEEADVAVKDGLIVGVGRGYEGLTETDAAGKVLIPGMIDAHLHIESTMLPPASFASVVLPLGTTTIFPDPHEIANTCGMSGIEFMWRESLRTPLDVFFAAPSCVPASPYETPFHELDMLQMMECYSRNWCSHMGEMMNFPGVLAGDEVPWSKITASWNIVKTAHLPNVRGKDLCAYLMSRCDGDHESNYADEALEKLRRGVWVMMREGATEHNLEEVAKIILEDEARFARCMAVSDDLTASHILFRGHMDYKVRLMVEMGIRPIVALAMVTINPANYFRMWDRGAIAPGRIADIVMVDSLEECRALRVWKRGDLAAEDGAPLFSTFAPLPSDLPKMTVLDVEISDETFRIPSRPGNIRVIEALPGLVLTKGLELAPTESDGQIVSDTERDILKIAVIEKNKGTGRTSLGFVKGFGLKKGAIASSVAHDAHNYVIVGADDRSMRTAARFLAENCGGLVVADGNGVLASLSLPIGGLMSDMEPSVLAVAQSRIIKTTEDLGATIPQPFMTLSFLSLSVIPELKLTDRGYVDASNGRLLNLFTD